MCFYFLAFLFSCFGLHDVLALSLTACFLCVTVCCGGVIFLSLGNSGFAAVFPFFPFPAAAFPIFACFLLLFFRFWWVWLGSLATAKNVSFTSIPFSFRRATLSSSHAFNTLRISLLSTTTFSAASNSSFFRNQMRFFDMRS